MCAVPAGFEAAFDAGSTRSCANSPRRAEWAQVREGLLGQFQWQAPAAPSRTRVGAEVDQLLRAVRQIGGSRGGQVFDRLMRDEEYASAYEKGYDAGRQDGADFALGAWKTEAAELIVALAQGLTTCMKDPAFLAKLTAATVQEYLLVPIGVRGHAAQDPRYQDLRRCLRSGLAQPPSPGRPTQPRPDAGVTPVEDAGLGLPDAGTAGSADAGSSRAGGGTVVFEPDPEEAEAAAAAGWTYEVGQIPNQVSDTGLISAIDIMTADWVGAMRGDLELLMRGIVLLNGEPCEQGYFVGWYVSHVVVQTLRAFVETATELAGPL